MQRFIAFIIFTAIFSSCGNKSKTDLSVFNAAEEGLEQSSKTIYYCTQIYYMGIEKKLADPSTATIASVWQPRAILIKEKTTEIINYLDLVTNKVKKETRAIDQKASEEMYQKLVKYKNDMLAVDPKIDKEFGKNSVIITQAFELDSSKEKDFTKTFFNDVPANAALTMLAKFKNNVRVLENQFVGYCYNNIGTVGGGIMILVPLISQSSNYIKAGGEMEIIAGVGAYYMQAQPRITINGIDIPFDNSQGFGKYIFKTPLKAGKYTIPVNVKFIDANGIQQSKKQMVGYTVVE
jgi:hypothetical protein